MRTAALTQSMDSYSEGESIITFRANLADHFQDFSIRRHDWSLVRVAAAGLLGLALVAVPQMASAVSSGVAGKTNGAGGCASCHGTAADPTISVTITGSATLTAGALGTYTVTASKPAAVDGLKMGVDVAASDGTLSVFTGQSTIVSGIDIVHNLATGALATTINTAASYKFNYTMPTTAAAGSTHTLFSVAHLQSVLNQSQSPGWNYGANFTVTVPNPVPVISSAATASGTVGQAFNYQIVASNSPTSYAVTGTLPANVTLNTANGLISGTPGNSGSFNVSVTASNSGGPSTPQSLTILIAPVPSIKFTAVQSRKIHGPTGSFDLTIDTGLMAPNITVDPRTIGSGHTIVFQFDGVVTAAGTVSVAPVGTASATFSGNEVLVTLTAVPDNQRVTVTLTGVNGSVNAPATAIGFLVGDINNSQSVNSSDISSVKARSGQTTSALNFKFDLNATGSINSSDISTVKARSGLTLP